MQTLFSIVQNMAKPFPINRETSVWDTLLYLYVNVNSAVVSVDICMRMSVCVSLYSGIESFSFNFFFLCLIFRIHMQNLMPFDHFPHIKWLTQITEYGVWCMVCACASVFIATYIVCENIPVLMSHSPLLNRHCHPSD